ncbi:protein lin-52 homolog isoform 4-T5 [Dama dama]|uniref:protein lin-52 homolog isoform X4 n=1 Tax=Dama dama TaxID=30532 RepID=UPI002A35F0B0|nr:protein lin-52 homolog isoform X4 [Dama dama]
MGAGRRTRLLGLRVEFLFGGVAYGSKLSRRRLATSRDMGWKMASPTDGADLEASLLSFEKLDRASPDLWPEQLPGVAEFAASFKSPITSSPPKWMAEIERDDIDMLKELGSLTTANLMEKNSEGKEKILEASREDEKAGFIQRIEVKMSSTLGTIGTMSSKF